MKFQFTINTNDQDYLDYNKFWMLRSHYGKKQMTVFRIIFAVIIIVANLAISAGCIVSPPNPNHRLAPLADIPIPGTKTNASKSNVDMATLQMTTLKTTFADVNIPEIMKVLSRPK